jgi:hypothetical protein
VCTDQGTGPGASAAALTLHDVEPVIQIDLEPVDSVVVTTVMDNLTDLFMPDQGPARRIGMGVVNIARYARRLCQGEPLYALLGGFHLNGPAFEPLIPRVLADLAELNPAVLVPGHCTGWRAQHAMSARFPGAFVPNAVGTSFYL